MNDFAANLVSAIIYFLLVVVSGFVPDAIVAIWIQVAGSWTGIDYLADASFWQGFWLAVIASSCIAGTLALRQVLDEL